MFAIIFYSYLEGRAPSLWVSLSVSSSIFCVFYYMIVRTERGNVVLSFLDDASFPFIVSTPRDAISSLILRQKYSFSIAAPMIPHFLASIPWIVLHILWTTIPIYVQYVYMYYFTFQEWLCVLPLNLLLPSFPGAVRRPPCLWWSCERTHPDLQGRACSQQLFS